MDLKNDADDQVLRHGQRDIPPDVLNAVLAGVGPQRPIAAANPSAAQAHQDGQDTPAAGQRNLSSTQRAQHPGEPARGQGHLRVGHCFCLEQRRLDGDPRRMDLPEEACLGLSPAAEHVIDRGFGRRISKQRAIKLVRESAERGAIHQVGRLVPLKDFRSKYEVDIVQTGPEYR